jgi:hypothetical protein
MLIWMSFLDTPGNSKLAVTRFFSLSSCRSILQKPKSRLRVHEIRGSDAPGLQGPDRIAFGALKLVAGASLELTRGGKIIEETIKVVERLIKPDAGHVEYGCLTISEVSGAPFRQFLYSGGTYPLAPPTFSAVPESSRKFENDQFTEKGDCGIDGTYGHK